MSDIILAVNDLVGQILAQGNPTVEPPPSSDRALQLMRYLSWLAVLVVPLLAIVAVIIAVRVTRSRRSRSQQQPLPAPEPNPGATPQHSPPHEVEDWGPPDPQIWGRPGQQ